MTPSRSGHLPINGLRLYHEVHGELGASRTAPLLLVPGAHMSTDSMAPWVSAFAGTRTVIVFDQQGHGRTPDTARELSYPAFADDAAALLRALSVERADVLGYSQGGGVALQLALRHPGLVEKLVTLSGAYRRDGWYPWVVAGSEDPAGASPWAGTSVERAFMAHTPDAAAFEGYVRKMRVFGMAEQTICDAEMRSISARAMVIAGDADDVQPEHTLAMFKLLGGDDADAATTWGAVPSARLVILPATHVGIFWQSALLEPMVSAFLDDVEPVVPSLF
jgi:pimeloyl-ACP methyl ester carboxylesterase